MKKSLFILILKTLSTQTGYAQLNDSLQYDRWSYHFQLTIISQTHSGFRSAYSGMNSLADTVEPAAESITSTLFLGKKLWKGASFYFNPEISGGKGLSYAVGVAGALNGETYRIGNPEPQIFIARAYYQQHIPLGNTTYETIADDVNQVRELLPKDRLTISAGKFAISDFFDDNQFSKDPRSQFFNWSLWANGAWDYPANTRGYTMGVVAELIHPNWILRFSSVAVPKIANHPKLEYVWAKAHSETIEIEKGFKLNNRKGTVKLLGSYTASRAPSYQQGLNALKNADTTILNVISGNELGKSYGGSKYGVFLNLEQELNNELGFFSRVGWNDGKYASWAFTEIDQSLSLGLSLKGNKWNRQADVFGIATVINGISKDHQNFLKQGGYGFIIGDGNLNYGHETIIETFYNAMLTKSFWLTLDYQFVNNPAYNKDRGPVHVFGIRGHIGF